MNTLKAGAVIVIFTGLVALSGCKEGLLDAGGQKGYLKNDLRNLVNISSCAVNTSILPELSKAGVIEVPKIEVKNTFVQDKPLVQIDRITVFGEKLERGYKKTVTYTKIEGKTKIMEVTVIEPVSKNSNAKKGFPYERIIIGVLTAVCSFFGWKMYRK